MDEPHQRTQSGKLRAVSRRSNSESAIKLPHELSEEYVGIASATKLSVADIEDNIHSYEQSPSTLTTIHTELLTKMARGYGISSLNAIDPCWRRTWNIGTWCIGNDISISINIMQPNISSIMAVTNCAWDDDIDEAIENFKQENSLAKSTVHHSKISKSKGYQLMGRWTLHVLQKLIDLDLIKKENIELSGANIGQSRIFCWMLVGQKSEYLCTLTKQSVEELMRFIPDWSSDIKEQNSASDITLRIKKPLVTGDSTYLSISTSGWIRYQGRLDNIESLPRALSTAVRSIMNSKLVFKFLDSLQYNELPENF